jgi:hypothetical protein
MWRGKAQRERLVSRHHTRIVAQVFARDSADRARVTPGGQDQLFPGPEVLRPSALPTKKTRNIEGSGLPRWLRKGHPLVGFDRDVNPGFARFTCGLEAL